MWDHNLLPIIPCLQYVTGKITKAFFLSLQLCPITTAQVFFLTHILRQHQIDSHTTQCIHLCLRLNLEDLRQFWCGLSSLPSPQSFAPLHSFLWPIQRPFPHRNWSGAHWGVPAIEEGESKHTTAYWWNKSHGEEKDIERFLRFVTNFTHEHKSFTSLNSAHLALLTAPHTFMLIWRPENCPSDWVQCCFTGKFSYLVSLRMTGRSWLSSLWFQIPQPYSACAGEESVPHFNHLICHPSMAMDLKPAQEWVSCPALTALWWTWNEIYIHPWNLSSGNRISHELHASTSAVGRVTLQNSCK